VPPRAGAKLSGQNLQGIVDHFPDHDAIDEQAVNETHPDQTMQFVPERWHHGLHRFFGTVRWQGLRHWRSNNRPTEASRAEDHDFDIVVLNDKL
jgi:hypothetical protein